MRTRTYLRAVPVAVIFTIFGCASRSSDSEGDEFQAKFFSRSSDHQVVFLNFGGTTLKRCPAKTPECSDAVEGASLLVSQKFHTSNVVLAAYDGHDETKVAKKVDDLFAPFDVEFVTKRPEEGPYTMVVISDPSSSPEGKLSGKYSGASIVDCGNKNPSDVVLVFTSIGGDLLGRVIAHELGHSFGLQHSAEPNSVMFTDSTPGDEPGDSWSEGEVSSLTNLCGGSSKRQDDAQVLKRNLGATLNRTQKN